MLKRIKSVEEFEETQNKNIDHVKIIGKDFSITYRPQSKSIWDFITSFTTERDGWGKTTNLPRMIGSALKQNNIVFVEYKDE